MLALYRIATLGLDCREMIYDLRIEEVLLCDDLRQSTRPICDISEIDLLNPASERVIAVSSCE